MWFEFMRSGWQLGLLIMDGRWRAILLSVALLGLSHPAVAAPASTATPILVMGDSLSAGYGIKTGTGWVTLLSKRLVEQGYEYQVVNASVSGETSSGGKVRLPGLLSIHKPTIMILELGANDGLRGLPNAQLRSNLSAMIEAARQAGSKVVLVGMQLPPNYGVTYTQGFSAVFAGLANSKHLPLVPFFLDGVALDERLMQGDDLHPNELGQPRLLENVWPLLRPLLKR